MNVGWGVGNGKWWNGEWGNGRWGNVEWGVGVELGDGFWVMGFRF